jgi:hypothetical protein
MIFPASLRAYKWLMGLNDDLPMQNAQWQKRRSLLIYRCGGSVGMGDSKKPPHRLPV